MILVVNSWNIIEKWFRNSLKYNFPLRIVLMGLELAAARKLTLQLALGACFRNVFSLYSVCIQFVFSCWIQTEYMYSVVVGKFKVELDLFLWPNVIKPVILARFLAGDARGSEWNVVSQVWFDAKAKATFYVVLGCKITKYYQKSVYHIIFHSE